MTDIQWELLYSHKDLEVFANSENISKHFLVNSNKGSVVFNGVNADEELNDYVNIDVLGLNLNTLDYFDINKYIADKIQQEVLDELE